MSVDHTSENWTEAHQQASEPKMTDTSKPTPDTNERCHANRDGECVHERCPQLRDNEPHKSGRHCPLDKEDDTI